MIVRDIEPTVHRVHCRLDGNMRQDDRTSDQIWPPAALFSLRMTHHSGDGIATGSSPGPGPIEPGGVGIEGIGILRNGVADRPGA